MKNLALVSVVFVLVGMMGCGIESNSGPEGDKDYYINRIKYHTKKGLLFRLDNDLVSARSHIEQMIKLTGDLVKYHNYPRKEAEDISFDALGELERALPLDRRRELQIIMINALNRTLERSERQK